MVISKNNVYSLTQAANLCAINRVTLWRWIKSGKLKAYKTPTGHYRIRKEDLAHFIQKELKYLTYDSDEQKKVLIIDFGLSFRKFVKKILSQHNIKIEEAESGFEAGLIIMKFKPALVILNIHIQALNELEICRIIKSDSNTKKIKILVIAEKGISDVEQRIQELGADGYLQKPVSKKDLLNRVESLLR